MCSTYETKIEDLEDIVKHYNEDTMNAVSENTIYIILSKFLTYLDEYKQTHANLYESNFNLYFSTLRPSFSKFYFRTCSEQRLTLKKPVLLFYYCLLYTSDAADEP